MKRPKDMIGLIATCNVCDWRDESYVLGIDAAKKHNAETKHDICLEMTLLKQIGRTYKAPKPEAKVEKPEEEPKNTRKKNFAPNVVWNPYK